MTKSVKDSPYLELRRRIAAKIDCLEEAVNEHGCEPACDTCYASDFTVARLKEIFRVE
jgi:hypothetical protein